MADIKNSSLATGIQAYWDLQEASGTRYDLVGSNNMTDGSSVPSATGKIGTCADFDDASTDYLSAADNAALDIDDGWSTQHWLYITSSRLTGTNGEYHYFLEKRSGENGVQHYIQRDAGSWYLYIGTGTGAFSATKVNVALSLDTWIHVVIYYNGASSKVYINGTSNSVSLNAITTTNTALVLGRNEVNTTWAGRMDEIGVWNRELTQSDVDTLYNSGSGIPYYDPDDISGDTTLTTSLVSYWELEETTGARIDSHGSNDLTPNNTPSYATGKIGNAVDLERSSEQTLSIAQASQTGLNITGDIAFSAWIQLESDFASGETRAVAGKWAADNGHYAFNLQNNGGTKQMLMQQYDNSSGTNNIGFRVNYTFTTATWYHVVWSYKASTNTMSLYVNGVLIGTTTGEGTVDVRFSGSAPFRIGDYTGQAASYQWDGLIDEVGIWSKVLTVAEVRALYGYGTPPEYSVGGSGPTNLKSRSGNLTANIKSISGNLIANVKTLSGNS